MTVEHHDLAHEFPEYKERIHELDRENGHFARLHEEYDELTRRIEALEKNGVPIADEGFEELKKRRLVLKDELYTMLKS